MNESKHIELNDGHIDALSLESETHRTEFFVNVKDAELYAQAHADQIAQYSYASAIKDYRIVYVSAKYDLPGIAFKQAARLMGKEGFFRLTWRKAHS